MHALPVQPPGPNPPAGHAHTIPFIYSQGRRSTLTGIEQLLGSEASVRSVRAVWATMCVRSSSGMHIVKNSRNAFDPAGRVAGTGQTWAGRQAAGRARG